MFIKSGKSLFNTKRFITIRVDGNRIVGEHDPEKIPKIIYGASSEEAAQTAFDFISQALENGKELEDLDQAMKTYGGSTNYF